MPVGRHHRRDGGIQITGDPARFETYADILTRHGLDELTIEGESAPPGETSSATVIVQAGRFIPYTAPSTGTRIRSLPISIEKVLGQFAPSSSSQAFLASDAPFAPY